MYVSLDSPKSISQLMESLRKIQDLEDAAIAALGDVVDSYRLAGLGEEYFEGLFAQVLRLFPQGVVKDSVAKREETEEEYWEIQNLKKENEELKEEVERLSEIILRDEKSTVIDGQHQRIVELQEKVKEFDILKKSHGLNVHQRQQLEAEVEKLKAELEEHIRLSAIVRESLNEENQQLKEKIGNLETELAAGAVEAVSLKAQILELKHEAQPESPETEYSLLKEGIYRKEEKGKVCFLIGFWNSRRQRGNTLAKKWEDFLRLHLSEAHFEIKRGHITGYPWELEVTNIPLYHDGIFTRLDFSGEPKPPEKPQVQEPKVELIKVAHFDPANQEFHVYVDEEKIGRIWQSFYSHWRHSKQDQESDGFDTLEEARDSLLNWKEEPQPAELDAF